jgi:hypothetical protein
MSLLPEKRVAETASYLAMRRIKWASNGSTSNASWAEM